MSIVVFIVGTVFAPKYYIINKHSSHLMITCNKKTDDILQGVEMCQ